MMNMKRKYVSVVAILALLFLAPVALHAQVNADDYAINWRKFNRQSHRSNAAILDVRTAEEYAQGHIPAARNIDVLKDDFVQNISGLDKSKSYLVYCRSGKRSAKALQIMKENGFTHVKHLKGGFEAWKGPVDNH